MDGRSMEGHTVFMRKRFVALATVPVLAALSVAAGAQAAAPRNRGIAPGHPYHLYGAESVRVIEDGHSVVFYEQGRRDRILLRLTPAAAENLQAPFRLATNYSQRTSPACTFFCHTP